MFRYLIEGCNHHGWIEWSSGNAESPYLPKKSKVTALRGQNTEVRLRLVEIFFQKSSKIAKNYQKWLFLDHFWAIFWHFGGKKINMGIWHLPGPKTTLKTHRFSYLLSPERRCQAPNRQIIFRQKWPDFGVSVTFLTLNLPKIDQKIRFLYKNLLKICLESAKWSNRSIVIYFPPKKNQFFQFF